MTTYNPEPKDININSSAAELRIQELEQNLISEAKFFADFTVWDETKYLLSSPANAERLLHSLAQARNSQFSAKQLIEESGDSHAII